MKKTFTGNTRLFLCISGAIIAIALILQIAGAGLNLGIDFTGGSILNYSVGEDYDVNDVEAILNASGYTDNQITKAAPSAASIALQAELAAAAKAAEETVDETVDAAADAAEEATDAAADAAEGEDLRDRFGILEVFKRCVLPAERSAHYVTYSQMRYRQCLLERYADCRLRLSIDLQRMAGQELHRAGRLDQGEQP